MREWTIEGSEDLPLHGVTHSPTGDPKGVVIVVHGFMGTKDRNIIPSIATILCEAGYVTHRFNLAHAGVERDADRITRHDEFMRDSWRFTHEDIRHVFDAMRNAQIDGDAMPITLLGHSRGGGAVVGYAGRAVREGWKTPGAVVSLSGIGWYSVMRDDVRKQLDEQGYYEVKTSRAEGGAVRCGPSWYAEHHDEGSDVFAEDTKLVRCPALLVHGEADDTVPMDHPRRVKELLEVGECPRAELVTIPNADHNFNSKGVGLDRESLRAPEAVRASEAVASFLTSLW